MVPERSDWSSAATPVVRVNGGALRVRREEVPCLKSATGEHAWRAPPGDVDGKKTCRWCSEAETRHRDVTEYFDERAGIWTAAPQPKVDHEPETWPHSAQAYPRHPTRSLEQYLFDLDVQLDETIRSLSAEDVKVFVERYKATAELAGLGTFELLSAAVWVTWSRFPLGSCEKVRGIINAVFGNSYSRETPFRNALDVFRFLVTNESTIGRGNGPWRRAGEGVKDGGFALALAGDIEANVALLSRLRNTSRTLPANADGTRARGYLPHDIVPAKQSRNGCTGQNASPTMRKIIDATDGADAHDFVTRASGESTVLLRAAIDRCIERASLPTLHLVVLRKCRIERVKPATVAEELRRHAQVEMSAEAVGKLASRTLAALAEQFQARGLIPAMQPTRPRLARAQAIEECGTGEIVPTSAPRIAS